MYMVTAVAAKQLGRFFSFPMAGLKSSSFQLGMSTYIDILNSNQKTKLFDRAVLRSHHVDRATENNCSLAGSKEPTSRRISCRFGKLDKVINQCSGDKCGILT